jgi:uncharacterized protein (TIGR01777 family)
MYILITGGTGFIGTALSRYLVNSGYQVTILTRNIPKVKRPLESINYITTLDHAICCYDVIINLAGEPLDQNRWNEKVKYRIYQSRIQMTQNLINYIKGARVKPSLLISGSAIGFYGNGKNAIFKEDSEPGDHSFTHQLCQDWEKVAMKASEYQVRVCLIRTGLVLGKEGGALEKMQMPFKLGLGATLGNGKQWMSWIHIEDVIRIIVYLIQHPHLSGAFNLTTPEPVTNSVFTHQLAKNLKRPSILTLPNFIVKMLFGEMANALLLQGQKVIPEKLTHAGYSFKFPKLADALEDILQ